MAAADLILVIPVIILTIICLIDAGLGCVYKQKLSFILTEAANICCNLPPEQDPKKKAEELVKELLKNCGLKTKNVKITLKESTIIDNDALIITAQADFPLLEGAILPLSITIRDTAVAIIPANRICASIAISPYPYSYENPQSGPAVYIPIIQPKHTMPIWEFPHDTVINNLHHVEGNQPNSNFPTPKNPYFADHPSLY